MPVTGATRHAFTAVAVAALLLGIVFRSWGAVVSPLDFWADEAWWHANFVQRSLVQSGIRPIGYMWLSQVLMTFDAQELALRLPSWIAALGTLAFVALSARRLFTSRAVVAFVVALVALHPELILFAKEFKPYSVETLAHSGLIWLAIVGVGQSAWLRVACAVVALPFAYNVVFLYPGLAARWFGERWRALAAVPVSRWLAAAVVLGIGLVWLYDVAFDALDAGPRRAFWADKYDVFPAGNGALAWYATKTWGLMGWPAALHELDGRLGGVARHLVAVAYLVGAAAMLRERRVALFALLCGPLLMTLIANVAGFWPYGAFRTNLFLIPCTALVAGVGLERIATSAFRWSRVGVVAVVVTMLVAAVPRDFTYHRHKHMRDGAPSPQLTAVLDVIAQRTEHDPSMSSAIVADWHSWRPLDYYLNRSPRGLHDYAALRADTPLLRGPLNELEALVERVDDARAAGATRVWLVVTKLTTLGDVLEHPLVERYGVRSQRFGAHVVDYHPVLIELRF